MADDLLPSAGAHCVAEFEHMNLRDTKALSTMSWHSMEVSRRCPVGVVCADFNR
jgi:hypothetical protein